MNAQTTATPTSWIGWYRLSRRQRWRPVVEADNEDAALDKLLNEPPGDKIVLPAGRNPNERGGRL
jgi:hypothetical protein